MATFEISLLEQEEPMQTIGQLKNQVLQLHTKIEQIEGPLSKRVAVLFNHSRISYEIKVPSPQLKHVLYKTEADGKNTTDDPLISALQTYQQDLIDHVDLLQQFEKNLDHLERALLEQEKLKPDFDEAKLFAKALNAFEIPHTIFYGYNLYEIKLSNQALSNEDLIEENIHIWDNIRNLTATHTQSTKIYHLIFKDFLRLNIPLNKKNNEELLKTALALSEKYSSQLPICAKGFFKHIAWYFCKIFMRKKFIQESIKERTKWAKLAQVLKNIAGFYQKNNVNSAPNFVLLFNACLHLVLQQHAPTPFNCGFFTLTSTTVQSWTETLRG